MATKDARLVPLDITSDPETQILKAQRKICTWGEHSIPLWREAVLAGHRKMYWICIPASSGIEGLDPLPSDPSLLAVGHIALDKIDVPSTDAFEPEPTLAHTDGSVMTIAALFVMPACAKGGLGSFAMLECEKMARRPPYGNPACQAVTVNTLAPRHTQEDSGEHGPEGTEVWVNAGLPVPQRSHVAWYKKMGYKAYKEALRYKWSPKEGVNLELYCVFLRKELGDE